MASALTSALFFFPVYVCELLKAKQQWGINDLARRCATSASGHQASSAYVIRYEMGIFDFKIMCSMWNQYVLGDFEICILDFKFCSIWNQYVLGDFEFCIFDLKSVCMDVFWQWNVWSILPQPSARWRCLGEGRAGSAAGASLVFSNRYSKGGIGARRGRVCGEVISTLIFM